MKPILRHQEMRKELQETSTISRSLSFSWKITGMTSTGIINCKTFRLYGYCSMSYTIGDEIRYYDGVLSWWYMIIRDSHGTIIWKEYWNPDEIVSEWWFWDVLHMLSKDTQQQRFKKDEWFFYGKTQWNKNIYIKDILNIPFIKSFVKAGDMLHANTFSYLQSLLTGSIDIPYTIEDTQFKINEENKYYSLLSLRLVPTIFFNNIPILTQSSIETNIVTNKDIVTLSAQSYKYQTITSWWISFEKKDDISLWQNIEGNTIKTRWTWDQYRTQQWEMWDEDLLSWSAHYGSFGTNWDFWQKDWGLYDTFSGNVYVFYPASSNLYNDFPDGSIKWYIYDISFDSNVSYEQWDTLSSGR